MRAAIAAVLLLLATSPVYAQAKVVPLGEPASQGVYNATVGAAGDGDASSIERNPALLGTLRSWSGVYLHSELSGSGVVGGRGDGFFFSSPLPYLSSLMLGGAVQLVRPPSDFPYANLAKISLSFAWRLHPMLSFGLTYAHLVSDQAPVAPGVDTLDLALAGRFDRHVAWGLVVHDVPSPSVGGVPLQRVYEPELAVRPFGNARLELAAGARFGERRGDIEPRFRLWLVAYPGVTLKADVTWRRNVGNFAENDVRAALGISLDLERVGASGFVLFGRDEGKTQLHGGSVALRISGERYPALWHGPRYLERVELTPELRGRKLLAVLDRLRALEHDESAVGVMLVGGEIGGGWAAAEELRAALLRLRRRGRHVLAFLIHVGSKGYLVATAAERIVLDPAGDLSLVGAAVTLPYFKRTGELFGLRADFVRIGDYKSAPERYTQSGPSAATRASRETYLDDLQRHLVDAIAASRSLSPEEVSRAIDRGPYAPPAAKDARLIDEVCPAEELGPLFERVLGAQVSLRDAPSAPLRPAEWASRRVAVLAVEGDLVGGPSREIPILHLRATGLTELATALEHAVADPGVRAIVLRVDSPGGSAVAADVLARAITAARATKPVVCSLGDLAASGGYYIASACDEIFAEPSTLTGSIGIYTGKIDFSGLLSKLGVDLTLMARGAHAGFDSPFRPYTTGERAALTKLLRYHYDRFVAQVARGRRLEIAQAEALAEGRIYSGDRARSLGLVDHYGGLADAIDDAARRAHLPVDPPIEIVPDRPSLLGQLGALVGWKPPAVRSASTGLSDLGEVLGLLPSALVFEPDAPQARLEAW